MRVRGIYGPATAAPKCQTPLPLWDVCAFLSPNLRHENGAIGGGCICRVCSVSCGVMRISPLFLLLGLVGCMVEPSKDRPYGTLAEYGGWWGEVEGCSGVTGDFGRLRFYILEGEASVGVLGRQRGTDIWVREDRVGDRFVVEHEMLHVLVGDREHRGAVWADCGLAP